MRNAGIEPGSADAAKNRADEIADDIGYPVDRGRAKEDADDIRPERRRRIHCRARRWADHHDSCGQRQANAQPCPACWRAPIDRDSHNGDDQNARAQPLGEPSARSLVLVARDGRPRYVPVTDAISRP